MALTFELEEPQACPADGYIYAVVHTLVADGDVRQLNGYLGLQMANVADCPLAVVEQTVEAMQAAKIPDRQLAGIMAVEVLKLCSADHAAGRPVPGRVPPRLERSRALVLTRGLEPLDIDPFDRPGKRTRFKQVNGDAPVAAASTAFLSAIPSEAKMFPVTQLIRSAPFTRHYRKGYVALRGFEELYNGGVRAGAEQV